MGIRQNGTPDSRPARGKAARFRGGCDRDLRRSYGKPVRVRGGGDRDLRCSHGKPVRLRGGCDRDLRRSHANRRALGAAMWERRKSRSAVREAMSVGGCGVV